MRNITSLFKKTPLNNGVYTFNATVKSDKHPGDFYTPYSITGWEFAEEFNPTNAKHNIIHEVSHVIDIYMRGDVNNRLLRSNFGWELFDTVKKMPRHFMLMELNAVCIQEVLTEKLMKYGRTDCIGNTELMDIYNERTTTPFANTIEEWNDIWQPTKDRIHSLGYDYFIDVWKSASKYVADNRWKLILGFDSNGRLKSLLNKNPA